MLDAVTFEPGADPWYQQMAKAIADNPAKYPE
jgi:hypothetical protein